MISKRTQSEFSFLMSLALTSSIVEEESHRPNKLKQKPLEIKKFRGAFTCCDLIRRTQILRTARMFFYLKNHLQDKHFYY